MNSSKGFKSLVAKAIQRFTAKKPLDGVNGVFFGDNHFLRVVEQPSGKPEFVSDISNSVTHFQLASDYGTIGLIAHNYLSGRFFSDLRIGDHIFTMNGYRQQRIYRVTRIKRFRALKPHSATSDFIDLDTQQHFTVTEVFKQVYTGDHHLTLQTCIQSGGNLEWGRLFIIADPIFSIPQDNNDFRESS